MKRKILLFLVSALLFTGCGKDTIALKDFEKGLEKFTKSEYSDESYEVNLKDGKMNINYNEENYTLDYNLKNNPTFTYEVKIEKGISYDDFLSKTEAISLPMIGYIASLDSFGVETEDATAYFLMTYIEGMMNYMDEEEKYIIADSKEGIETDAEIILTSEFGDKVIEYVKSSSDKDIEIKDKENNTFEYKVTTECKETECIFKSVLTVNKDGKFDELKGYADEMAKENMDSEITLENADYNIELVVGQTLKVNGTELNGYEISGMDVLDEDENTEEGYIFKATKEGIANGRFYIGDSEEKTFYLTVSENKNDKAEDKLIVVE